MQILRNAVAGNIASLFGLFLPPNPFALEKVHVVFELARQDLDRRYIALVARLGDRSLRKRWRSQSRGSQQNRRGNGAHSHRLPPGWSALLHHAPSAPETPGFRLQPVQRSGQSISTFRNAELLRITSVYPLLRAARRQGLHHCIVKPDAHCCRVIGIPGVAEVLGELDTVAKTRVDVE